MSALQPFAFADQQVRVVLDSEGEPWFVAGDVASILGYREAHDLTRSLEADEKGPQAVRTPGGQQVVTAITEAGMYSAIMLRRTGAMADSGQRELVRSFQRWVTHEVLPSIRKTGAYSAASAVAVPDLSTPAGVLAMAEQLTATARALVAASEKVAELEPKAEVADKLLTADGDMSVGDAAKALTRAGVTVGANRLFSLLETWKWVYRAKGDGRWRVMQAAIESGHMSVLPQSHYHPRTGVLVLDPPQPRLTPKGLARLLREHGVDKFEAVALAEQMVTGAEP